jgi:hypothetical protein
MKDSVLVKNNCLYCGEGISGRSDKLFCDVECKNAFHRAQKTEAKETFARIGKILKKNRDILKEVLGNKTTEKISMEKLVGKGYDNDYLTHIKLVGSKKRNYYYTYDYGYRVDEDGGLTVVKAFH